MPRTLQIKLYKDDGSVDRSFTRSFVPWRVMKRAAKLAGMNMENMTPELVDEMTSLVVDVFGDQFSAEDLNNQAKPDEVTRVLTGIMEMVNGGGQPNPPIPG